MPSKAEREQAKVDAVQIQEARSSRISDILNLVLVGKDIYDLVLAELRVLSGDATEQDLIAAKRRKAGLDGRLEEIRAKFRQDTEQTT
jgi:hypothetical protein